MKLLHMCFLFIATVANLSAQTQPPSLMPPPSSLGIVAPPLPLSVQEPPAILVEPQDASLLAPAAPLPLDTPPLNEVTAKVTEKPVKSTNEGSVDEPIQKCEIKISASDKSKEFLKQLDAAWYALLESIAILAFALSGLIVAYQTGASLFGTVLLSFLPPFGGGILRDLILGKSPTAFVQSQANISMVFAISVVGFFVLGMNRHRSTKDIKSRDASLIRAMSLFDGIGLSIFTVTGTMVALEMHLKPLWIWGPLAAMITFTMGGVLRDQLIRNNSLNLIHGPLYPEIGMFC